MLIPTENSYNDGIGTMLNEGDLLLDGESMKIIANKIKFRIAEPDLGKLVEAMRLSVGADSLFTEIYERGIPEGLTGYGKT